MSVTIGNFNFIMIFINVKKKCLARIDFLCFFWKITDFGVFHVNFYPVVTRFRECGQCRLRVVPLSLSPSCVTRKKIGREKNSRAKSWERGARERSARALLTPRISRGYFFLPVFFRVTHDGLSERGTTRSPGQCILYPSS